jgi:hypothetical protein
MEIKTKFKPNPEYRLMDQVREVLRYYHYSYRTEQSYSAWILQYIKFYGKQKHPKDMGKNEVERFLSYLTEKRNVAAATQKQALNALVFLPYSCIKNMRYRSKSAKRKSSTRMMQFLRNSLMVISRKSTKGHNFLPFGKVG